MFYEKKYPARQPERKKIPLSNFLGYDENKKSRELPCDYVDCVYNYRFKNNKLIGSYGVSEFKIGDYVFPPTPKIKQGDRGVFCATMYVDDAPRFTILISHKDGIDFCCKGDKEWRHMDARTLFTYGTIYYISNEPCLFMAGLGGVEWFVNNVLYTSLRKRVIDICVHYERLFIVVEESHNSVWFSKSGNPMVWDHEIDKGGYINFDGTLGEVNTIKSFNNYLYVFCDYGIYRLTAYGDQTQFNLKKIYTSSGRIYAKSVTICGEYIAFAGEDGIFLFDGYDVSRYTTKVNDLISSGFDDVTACYSHDKYIISFTNNTQTDYGVFNLERDNNMLLVFNLVNKNVEIMRGVSFKYMCAVNEKDYSKVIAISDDCDRFVELDESGLYLGKPMLKYWESGEIDFGRPSEVKLLRSVEYNAKSEFYLGIICNGERKEFLLSPREKKKSLYVKAKEFKFYIRSDNEKEEIYPPTLVVDFIK
ncbi:MAG: hypothetical protein K2O95_07885 [Clostridia bacterium]|nr:hypothetical protein [Clostridia bacterium]MDE7080017.1 hypothetical protein [Clostridia bacterium]